jgi:hypothetical protein
MTAVAADVEASRSGSTWWTPRSAYLVASAVLVALLTAHTLNHLWTDLDFWVWLGPVRAFAARPWHPGNPLLAVDAPDPYLGPWSWLLGVVSRVTGVAPFTTLAIGGMVNAILLLVGIRMLTRRVTDAPWAPLFALAFSLSAWGFGPWRGSGYLNLNSLGTALPLGSMFATALGLVALARLWDWCARGRTRDLAVATVLFVVVMLTHQITGLWVTLVAVGIALGVTPRWTARRAARAGGAAVVALVLLSAWPFFPFFSMLRASGDYDWINPWSYRSLPVRVFLALPAVPMLVLRWRRSRRDPLVIAETLIVMVLVFGWVGNRITLGRCIPGALLVAHLAMADWFARKCARDDGSTRAVTWARVGAAVIVVVGLVGSVGGLARMVPRPLMPASLERRLGRPIDRWRGFADLLRADDVVVAPDAATAPIGGLAARTVATWLPAPFVDDSRARRRAQNEMIAPTTAPDRRRVLLDHFRVSVVVVPEADLAAVLPELDHARVVGRVNGDAVIRLRG